METLKRPLNYQYYYWQSDSVFCIDLINAIHHVFYDLYDLVLMSLYVYIIVSYELQTL